MGDYRSLINELRSIMSRSKRELLDKAAEAIELLSDQWCDPEIELPTDEDINYLVIVSGHDRNIKLIKAYQLAAYYRDDGWVLECFPEMKAITVHYWMPMPEPPKENSHDRKRSKTD